VKKPDFRIPGLLRADGVEEYLASRGIQVWSADFLADDWHHISSARVADLAIKRLEADGKGILLLHDIQARTVAALPKILHEMKARGYHIVHVVPATPQQPATPTELPQWQLHPPSENVPIAHWPKIPNFVFAEVDAFPAPVLPNFAPRTERCSFRANLSIAPGGLHKTRRCRARRPGRGSPSSRSRTPPLRCRCPRKSGSRCLRTPVPLSSPRRRAGPRLRPSLKLKVSQNARRLKQSAPSAPLRRPNMAVAQRRALRAVRPKARTLHMPAGPPRSMR
jgi:hypothetical protein